MALKRTVSALTGGVTAKQVKQCGAELNARVEALKTWDRVAFGLGGKFDRSYLWQVAMDKRKPSRRLLLALGIVKAERRTDIRIRMTVSDARKVEQGIVPVNVANRVRYALWGVK